jgi:beta-phosphoglucomutase-like phosphatase (HAD superfamily)
VKDSDQQPDGGRPRPVATVLDVLRKHVDHDAFDAAIFSLEAVAADLGYGDVRPLPGTVAWIDRLRGDRKRIAVLASGERVAAALELAGIADRFDVVLSGPHTEQLIPRAMDELDVDLDRAVVVGVDQVELEAGREAGAALVIGVAHEGAPRPSSSGAPAPTRSSPTSRSCCASPEPTTLVFSARTRAVPTAGRHLPSAAGRDPTGRSSRLGRPA